MTHQLSSWDSIRDRLLADPEVKAESDALGRRFSSRSARTRNPVVYTQMLVIHNRLGPETGFLTFTVLTP
jgi:hypothetical protein